jgi:uncharacterized protein YbjT (DUF2867 family)
MDNTQQVITIFGGSGFVGQYIVRDLARAGYRLRLVERDVVAAASLKTQGEVGQISVTHGDITKPESYVAALEGAYAVINLVGILFERGQQTFAALHAAAPEKLSQIAVKAGVKHFLHMSALGVDKATTSRYAATKLAGENVVRAAFPQATIFRPSVIFGAEDNFYNQFACMSRFSPFLPLIGGGKTKFQPVYVADVAQAFLTALQHPESAGRTYELGGAVELTFQQILASIKEMTNRSPYLLTIPTCIAKLGATFTQLLPTPLLTKDQVELLKYDNVVSASAYGFKDLGITPKHPDDIVPTYLSRFVKERPIASTA